MNEIKIVRTGTPRPVAIGSIEKFPAVFDHLGQLYYMNRAYTKPSKILGKRLMTIPRGYSLATGEITEFNELTLVELYENGAVLVIL